MKHGTPAQGLCFLSRIPPQDLFRLFVDGKLLVQENGQAGFVTREPGCMEAFYTALAYAIDALLIKKEPLSINHLLQIHWHATKGILTKAFSASRGRGEIRTVTMRPFSVALECLTEEGIIALLTRFRETSQKGELLNPPEKLFISRFNKYESNLLERAHTASDETIKKIAKELYETLDNKFNLMCYTPPGSESKQLRKKIKEILKHFHEQKTLARSLDEKILAIVDCVQALELLHPFVDANGRTFVNVVKSVLLMGEGLPPPFFYDPNLFDLSDRHRIATAVKEAMRVTMALIKNQNLALFGYRGSEGSNAADTAKIFLVDALRKAFNYTESIDEEYEKELMAFLDAPCNTDARVWQDVVIGIAPPPDYDCMTLSPLNAPPYKERSLFAVACLAGQVSIAIEIALKIPKNALNETDKAGRLPLYYAILTKDVALVEILLKQGASPSSKDKFNQEYAPIFYSACFGTPEIFECVNQTSQCTISEYYLLIGLANRHNNFTMVKYFTELLCAQLSKDRCFRLPNATEDKNYPENPSISLEFSLHSRNIDMFLYFWEKAEKPPEGIPFAYFKILLPNLIATPLSVFKQVFDHVHIQPSDRFHDADSYEILKRAAMLVEQHTDGPAIFKLLLSLVKDKETRFAVRDETILHIIAETPLIELLEDCPPTLFNAVGTDMGTPLLIAANCNQEKMVEALCKRGADPNDPIPQDIEPEFFFNKEGHNKSNVLDLNDLPIIAATRNGNVKIVKILLDYGAIIPKTHKIILEIIDLIAPPSTKEEIKAIFESKHVLKNNAAKTPSSTAMFTPRPPPKHDENDRKRPFHEKK
ncbi:MAG: hypothetical protein A3E84_00775 [Gammaproteobacteria bacterium RIFCSPHIGHO2_12_FULL_42_13]|nr:MAG: hypothetical protein A3E84_00775 [Gammaproteobacteria bacterium RIFCSPHIGHO2_12_FULL_42_13]